MENTKHAWKVTEIMAEEKQRFVTWETLKPHLPAFVCKANLSEGDLDKIVDLIEHQLILEEARKIRVATCPSFVIAPALGAGSQKVSRMQDAVRDEKTGAVLMFTSRKEAEDFLEKNPNPELHVWNAFFETERKRIVKSAEHEKSCSSTK